MAAQNFAAFVDFLERPDFDGQPLHRTAGDPGGDTSWGWTFKTWQSYCYLNGGDDSIENFSAMSKADFRLPTRVLFWNGIMGDDMPSGIDVFWADFHFGSGGSNRVLQGVIHTLQDGLVGAQTVKAAHVAPPGVIDRMLAARVAYYQTLETYSLFGHGWTRRAIACAGLARSLL